MLPIAQKEKMKVFAKRFNIVLNDILHTEFENKALIHKYLQQHDFGRFPDILRYEEALAGIYTDTDVLYSKPFPKIAQLELFISQNYGLLTSEENLSIGVSTSLIVRPYGCPVMAACRKKIALNPEPIRNIKLIPIVGHTAQEVSVIHDTGPSFLSGVIAEVVLHDPRPHIYNLHDTTIDFSKLVFTRVYAGTVLIPCDLTWTKEGRQTFEKKQYEIKKAIEIMRRRAREMLSSKAMKKNKVF
jgi:hypothetical protein